MQGGLGDCQVKQKEPKVATSANSRDDFNNVFIRSEEDIV